MKSNNQVIQKQKVTKEIQLLTVLDYFPKPHYPSTTGFFTVGIHLVIPSKTKVAYYNLV